ncbi:hypothetical protein [Georgenia sp. AZ-5]|uniref:hypothetical protein n=1 Tax=Georgenia sp. AZ-5 TaxID=3367526 RepID=UPI0037544AF5
MELACGLVVVAAVLLAARRSSLGAQVVGLVTALAGAAVVAAPGRARDLLDTLPERLHSLGGLGANLAHHLVADAASGRLMLYGLALLAVGVVARGARRAGRREERLRAETEGLGQQHGPGAVRHRTR